MRLRALGALVLAVLVAAPAGCGGGGKTRTITRTKVIRVVPAGGGGSGSSKGFDPAAIYKAESPGVVTIVSIFGGGSLDSILGGGGGGGGLGSGFVLDQRGEIVTNAHVVTEGQGSSRRQADQVYVQFADGNRVRATVRGYDPNADVALLRVDPAGLKLVPLPLGNSDHVPVGAPVAAMGSPFGEDQSLSVGVVSAVGRSVSSLTRFDIAGAIQTDAAINPGNSGGPLVDARGRVLGLNQQIQSQSGGGEGVGFAVPINLAKRSVAQLRAHGHVDYAYLGVSTQDVYPQLATQFHLTTKHGAWIQQVTPGGPAAKAGLRAGSGGTQRFQAQSVTPGGDVIVSVAGQPVSGADTLGAVVEQHRPGETVPVVAYRDGKRRTFRVKLGKRPLELTSGG
jgi:S1-C subfamily serine protease